MSEAGGKALIGGLTYRVYYLDEEREDQLRKLLAIEPTGAPEA